MKKITLLFTFLAISFGYSQDALPHDFGTAATPTLHGYVAGDGAVVTNEIDPDDANNSVMQIVGNGTEWDNAQLDFATQIDLSDDSNNTIAFRFRPMADYGTRIHRLKFESGTTDNVEVAFESTGTAWQDIEVDMPCNLGTYTRIVFFADFNNALSGTYLIDDVALTSTTPTTPSFPLDFSSSDDLMTAGDGADVSIVSGQLQIIGIVHDWDNASIVFCDPVDLTDDDNNTMRFTMQSTTAAGGEVHKHGLKFEGGGNPPAEMLFYTTGQEVTEVEVDFGAGLGAFPKMVIFVDVSDLGSSTPTPNTDTGTYLIDNIMAPGATILGVEDFRLAGFSAYPNPTKDSWTVKSKNQNIASINVFDVLGKQVLSLSPNADEVSIDATKLKRGIYFAQIKTEIGTNSVKLIKQ